MRNLILGISIVLVGLLTACGGRNGGDAKYEIAVIPKSVSFDFWNTVHVGAQAAAAELDSVRISWKGTSDETDIAGQVQIVESFINQGVDAIVIAAADARGLVPVLRRAKESGVVVITIDSNTDPQISESFIATDNVDAARKAAELVAESLNGEGEVAVIPYIAGASTSNDRERGFKEGIQGYEGITVVATQYSQSDHSRAMAVTEDLLTAYPDLDAIFGANEPSVIGAAQAVKSRGLTDRITLVGFDASPQEIEGVRSGVIKGLIVQDPFRMGYEGVVQAVAVLNGEAVSERIDSGSIVVTRENLDEFLERREQEMTGSTADRDTSFADVSE